MTVSGPIGLHGVGALAVAAVVSRHEIVSSKLPLWELVSYAKSATEHSSSLAIHRIAVKQSVSTGSGQIGKSGVRVRAHVVAEFAGG